MRGRGAIDERVNEYLPLARRLCSIFIRRRRAQDCEARLWSAAMKALWDAARTFDDKKKVPFEAFATIRINGELADELKMERRLWGIVERIGCEIEDEIERVAKSGIDAAEHLDRVTDGLIAGAVLGFAAELLRKQGEEGLVLCETRRRFLEAFGEIAERLPEEDKAILELHYKQGIAWEKLVPVLRVPERTLKRRNQRMLARLGALVAARGGRRHRSETGEVTSLLRPERRARLPVLV